MNDNDAKININNSEMKATVYFDNKGEDEDFERA